MPDKQEEKAGNSSEKNKNDESDRGSDEGTQLYAMSRHVKIPPFWNKNPQLWFHQLDAQFTICKVTKEVTKFNYVVSALDMEVLAQVSDLITTPPREPYTAVKQRLVSSFGDTEERRIKRLLKELELGDKRPSHLLQEMRQLAGTLVSEDFLKTLWIQQLPSSVRAVVMAGSENLPELAILADRVIEVASVKFESCAISTTSATLSSQVSELQKQVASLSDQLCNLSMDGRSSWRGRSNSRGRSRSFTRGGRSASRSRAYDADICWYHRKFSSKATKCTKPCKYEEN